MGNETNGMPNRIKACLFTLIIYTREQRRLEYFRNLVQMIVERFPCKIIFIQIDQKHGNDFFQVQSSTTTIGKGDQTVSCEQVNIEASQNLIDKLHFDILPHLVPDLPVYLIWGQDPITDSKLLASFQTFATRIIFDSETSENLHTFSKNMLAQIDQTKHNIVDMNWVKIGPWRNVMFQTFDSPERIEQLNQANTITISYNRLPTPSLHHDEIQAVYLQAWIASRLNWKLKCVDNLDNMTQIVYINNLNKEVQVKLICLKNESFLPSVLLSIDVISGDTSVSIKRMEKLAQATVHISKAETCDVPFSIPLPNLQKGSAFLKELFYSTLSSHYVKMLRILDH